MIRRFRLSIAGLLAVILFAVLGLAAWRNPNDTWDGGIFLLTCGVLTLAVVGALCRSWCRASLVARIRSLRLGLLRAECSRLRTPSCPGCRPRPSSRSSCRSSSSPSWGR